MQRVPSEFLRKQNRCVRMAGNQVDKNTELVNRKYICVCMCVSEWAQNVGEDTTKY